jgi:hypothetical protein
MLYEVDFTYKIIEWPTTKLLLTMFLTCNQPSAGAE